MSRPSVPYPTPVSCVASSGGACQLRVTGRMRWKTLWPCGGVVMHCEPDVLAVPPSGPAEAVRCRSRRPPASSLESNVSQQDAKSRDFREISAPWRVDHPTRGGGMGVHVNGAAALACATDMTSHDAPPALRSRPPSRHLTKEGRRANVRYKVTCPPIVEKTLEMLARSSGRCCGGNRRGDTWHWPRRLWSMAKVSLVPAHGVHTREATDTVLAHWPTQRGRQT
ncbi:hypothetical protein OF83DRAFT_1287519 [Amylostereum chailletii]|nr:hypothetical protein OF83DRAFT_1287519 [Amylostereum chailletii]